MSDLGDEIIGGLRELLAQIESIQSENAWRRLFAGLAMAGLLANSGVDTIPASIAMMAEDHGNALLAELKKREAENPKQETPNDPQ